MNRTPVEIALQACFTILTHVSMVPAAWLCFKLQLPVDTTVAFFTILTSLVYHTLELSELTAVGGNTGRWHVADNVFAASAFCIAAINFIQYNVTYTVVDGLKTLAICVNVICQLISPWDVRYTYFPILVCVSCIIIFLSLKRKRPHILVQWLLTATLSCTLSLVFFVWGLDDEHDKLRFYHGLWHIGVSVFMFAVLRAANPPGVVAVRLEAHKKAQAHITTNFHIITIDPDVSVDPESAPVAWSKKLSSE